MIETLKIKPETLTEMNRILRLEHGLADTKQGEKIQSWSVGFEDGCSIDLTVYNGGDTDSPWIDAVLFDEHGNELACIASYDQLDKNYYIVFNNEMYVVAVS